MSGCSTNYYQVLNSIAKCLQHTPPGITNYEKGKAQFEDMQKKYGNNSFTLVFEILNRSYIQKLLAGHPAYVYQVHATYQQWRPGN